MKPDSGLARIFEGVKGFTECPCRPMGRIVAEYAQGVKEVGDLRRQNPLEPQAPKQIGLRFIARFIKTRLRGDELGQQFGELAKLDKARIWVVVEVSFGERTQPHELHVVLFKEKEIARFCPHALAPTPAPV
jgi:hypothetical protein